MTHHPDHHPDHPAGGAGAVKVKPLEWQDEERGANQPMSAPRYSHARTPVRNYNIHDARGARPNSPQFRWTLTADGRSLGPSDGVFSGFSSMAEAKTAAQADYETRILSALAPVPEPVYKEVERILDEESAWVARPNDEVTRRIALSATIAALDIVEKQTAAQCDPCMWDQDKPCTCGGGSCEQVDFGGALAPVPEPEAEGEAVAFIAKLVNMQSGAGWSRAVVRDAAARFLQERGLKVPNGPDSTPEMIRKAALSLAGEEQEKAQ